MAGSVNKVIVLGHLGQDPEYRMTPAGQSVATLNLATNERFQKDGNWEDRTEWHRIVVWGKQADRCKNYLKKGSQIFVEGRLQTRSWEDREGIKRYTTEIVASSVQFLSGTIERAAGRDMPPPDSEYPEYSKAQPDAEPPSRTVSQPQDDEDFPF